MRVMPTFAFVVQTMLGVASSALAQDLPFELSAQDTDGILQFSPNGVSRLEFVISRVPGPVGFGLRFDSGAPFTTGDGYCQVSYVSNLEAISQYGVSPNSNEEWVVIVIPVLQLESVEDYQSSAVGVTCFARG